MPRREATWPEDKSGIRQEGKQSGTILRDSPGSFGRWFTLTPRCRGVLM
jgi:hypothetical protein